MNNILFGLLYDARAFILHQHMIEIDVETGSPVINIFHQLQGLFSSVN